MSVRTDTLAETEEVVERENGTEIGRLQDATQEETTMTDHQGETETFLTTEEAVVEDDVVIEAIAMAGSEEALAATARRAQARRLRRRSLRQTSPISCQFWSGRDD